MMILTSPNLKHVGPSAADPTAPPGTMYSNKYGNPINPFKSNK